jgi:hypothetical protein
MPIQVKVFDQMSPGSDAPRPDLQVESTKPTLRELIRERVRQEVTAYNEKLPEVYSGLVQPEDSERLLNGYRVKTKKPLDWQRQFEAAVSGFEQNAFFVLIDDEAVESLDATVELRPATEIRFLRLVPLMGG